MGKEKITYTLYDTFPFIKAPENLTIREAQNKLFEKIGEGSICPCCNQRVQRYKRPLIGVAARDLVWLYNNTEVDEYIHIKNIC